MSARSNPRRAARVATAPKSLDGTQDDPRSFIEPAVPLRRSSDEALAIERRNVWDGTPTQEVTGMLMSADGRTARYEMARRVR